MPTNASILERIQITEETKEIANRMGQLTLNYPFTKDITICRKNARLVLGKCEVSVR